MSVKHKSSSSLRNSLIWLFAGLILLGLIISQLLAGKNIAILNSKGVIASQQRSLILYALTATLLIAVPTVLTLYFTAWRYRESHGTATFHPATTTSKWFTIAIWGVPSVFVMVLAFVLIPATRDLRPNKALASTAKPITIQVIAMRWKWLFIYPDQQIATVNYVQIPKNVPIIFDLTADEAPMSSFWVPNLSGQLYAMTGHINRLNIMASELGDYRGRSAEINGPGFADMQFTTRVSNAPDFAAWVSSTKQSAGILDSANYHQLVQPSQNNVATAFYPVDSTLYASTVMKYLRSHDQMMSQQTQNGDMHE